MKTIDEYLAEHRADTDLKEVDIEIPEEYIQRLLPTANKYSCTVEELIAVILHIEFDKQNS